MSKVARFLIPLVALVAAILIAVKLLHRTVTTSQLLASIRHFPVLVLLLMIGIVSAMILLRAIRFYLFLRDNEVEISWLGSVKVFVAGQALSPLPAGETSRALLIKLEANQSPKKAITPMLLLGVTEMISAVVITVIGSLFLGVLRTAALIALAAFLGVVWLLINHKAVELLIHRAPEQSKVKKAGKAVIAKQKEVKGAIFPHRSWLPSRLFTENLLLAIATGLLGGLIIFLAARSYQLPLSFIWSFYVFGATTVLGELLPFMPGGIGLTESGMTGILLVSGAKLSQALAVVIIFRVVTLVYGFLLGLIVLFTFYSRKYWQYAARTRHSTRA